MLLPVAMEPVYDKQTETDREAGVQSVILYSDVVATEPSSKNKIKYRFTVCLKGIHFKISDLKLNTVVNAGGD